MPRHYSEIMDPITEAFLGEMNRRTAGFGDTGISRQIDVLPRSTQRVTRGVVDPETGGWLVPPGMSFPDQLGGTFLNALRDVAPGIGGAEGIGGAPAIPPQIIFPGADPGMQQRGAGFPALTSQGPVLTDPETGLVRRNLPYEQVPFPEVRNAPSQARQEMLAHIAARKAAQKQMRAGHGVRTMEQVEELLGKLSSLTEGEKDAVRSGQMPVADAIKRENIAREGRAQAGAEERFEEVREEGKRLSDQYTDIELLRRAAEEAGSRGDDEEAWRLEKLAVELERAEEVHEGAEAAFDRGSDALEGFKMGVRGTPHTTTEEFNVDMAGLRPLAAEEYAKRRTTTVGGKQGVFHPEDVPGTATISGPTGMQYSSVDPSRVVLGGRTGSDETDVLRSEPGVLHPTENRVITRGEREAIKQQRTQRIADIADRQRVSSQEFRPEDLGLGRAGMLEMRGLLKGTPGEGWAARNNPTRLVAWINSLSARENNAPGQEPLNANERLMLAAVRKRKAGVVGDRDLAAPDRIEGRRRAEQGLLDARAARALTPLGQKREDSTKAEERRARMAMTAAHPIGSGARAWAMPVDPGMLMNPEVAGDIAKARILAEPNLIEAKAAAAAANDPRTFTMGLLRTIMLSQAPDMIQMQGELANALAGGLGIEGEGAPPTVPANVERALRRKLQPWAADIGMQYLNNNPDQWPALLAELKKMQQRAQDNPNRVIGGLW